jgi:hypothetical protein
MGDAGKKTCPDLNLACWSSWSGCPPVTREITGSSPVQAASPLHVVKNSQVAELAYKPSALPIIGEMGMYNTITGSNPVLTTMGWLVLYNE